MPLTVGRQVQKSPFQGGLEWRTQSNILQSILIKNKTKDQ